MTLHLPVRGAQILLTIADASAALPCPGSRGLWQHPRPFAARTTCAAAGWGSLCCVALWLLWSCFHAGGSQWAAGRHGPVPVCIQRADVVRCKLQHTA